MNPHIPDCYYRISTKALIRDETGRKFLLCKEDNNRYDFPGGGLDFGESPQEGIIRELHEEAGLTVTSVADEPSFFITMKKDSGDGIWVANVFYETTVLDLNFTPSEECIALEFVSPEDVVNMDVYSSVTLFAEHFAKSLGNK